MEKKIKILFYFFISSLIINIIVILLLINKKPIYIKENTSDKIFSEFKKYFKHSSDQIDSLNKSILNNKKIINNNKTIFIYERKKIYESDIYYADSIIRLFSGIQR